MDDLKVIAGFPSFSSGYSRFMKNESAHIGNLFKSSSALDKLALGNFEKQSEKLLQAIKNNDWSTASWGDVNGV